MSWENPGAYDEARKRIRENKESETVVIKKKKEDFEKSKEKIHSKKKLDVFELRRRIETGHSLNTLKSDIQEALRSGQISRESYDDTLAMLEKKDTTKIIPREPEYQIDDTIIPLAQAPLTTYFERQKLGDNLFIDIAGFTYWVAQGSLFLFYLAGRMILDTLLLPRDIYSLLQK